MFVKKFFGACIQRPSNRNDLSRVDHSETVKWYSDVIAYQAEEQPVYRPLDYGIKLTELRKGAFPRWP